VSAHATVVVPFTQKTNKTKTECSLKFLFRSLEACSSAKTTATARVSKTKTNSKRKQQETN